MATPSASAGVAAAGPDVALGGAVAGTAASDAAGTADAGDDADDDAGDPPDTVADVHPVAISAAMSHAMDPAFRMRIATLPSFTGRGRRRATGRARWCT